MRALKMRSAEASPQKLTTTNWEQSSKLVLLQLHKKLLKNSESTILWSFGIWSKLERWKSSISGCLMSWPKIKKKVILKCLLLFYVTTTNHFLVGLWCVAKSGFYTIGNDQLSSWRNSKALPKAKLAPKYGHCLVFCCLSDPLKLSESQRNHYILEVCSANWWDALKTATPASSIGQQKGPDSSLWQHPTTYCTTNSSKVEWIGLWSFASFVIFSWPLTNQWPLSQASWQLFADKMLPHPAGGR